MMITNLTSSSLTFVLFIHYKPRNDVVVDEDN